jgi:E3 ubiquitin-protein ligase UHRF1
VVCEECEHWYHWRCLDPPLTQLPKDNWYCPECRNDTTAIVRPGQSGPNKKMKLGKINKLGGGMSNVGFPKVCTIVGKAHRGPIPGIEVGQSWKSRALCGGDGVHRSPISGIAGSASDGGAVSIVFSDGYPEDKDCGETFTYAGSGGRDAKAGNGRIAMQSFDQELTRYNLALAVTCNAEVDEAGATAVDWRKSLGIRVVRSSKLRKWHPKYAPGVGYRYDGIYKIVSYRPTKNPYGLTVYRFE